MHRCSAMKKNDLLLFLVYLLFYFALLCLVLAWLTNARYRYCWHMCLDVLVHKWIGHNVISSRFILIQHEMHVACTSHAIFIPIYALHNYVMFGRQNDKIHRRMSLSKHIIKICHNRRQLIITLQCVIFGMHLPFLICE